MDLNVDLLLEYFKTRNFELLDNTKITKLEIEKHTHNPFDTGFRGNLEFDNDLLITISKGENCYEIRMGKNKGWIGGLAFSDIIECFKLHKEVTTESLIQGFKDNENNQTYSLESYYGSGMTNNVLLTGSIEELDKFAMNRWYTKKESHKSFKNTFREFYYDNYHYSRNHSDKLLKIIPIF